MIDVKEAQQIILSTVRVQPAEECGLSEACGRVLAEDLASPISMPLFDNSAMDGYALRSCDVAAATEDNPVYLTLSGEVAAGDGVESGMMLQPHHAAQIFTGAMVPAGADAVIRQEDVTAEETKITIKRAVKLNENIRFMGEEIRHGDKVLTAGTRLSPAGVGVLASLGQTSISVFSRPRVGILVTGSEIVGATADLRPGKIFDSNSFALAAALRELDIPVTFQKTCIDDRETLQRELIDGLNQTDVLLVTGGVSVGKYDFVKETAAKVGIEELFWRVKQKPGKPIFFGATTDRTKLFFGLPGNPASVLVSFYEYVRPALLSAMGMRGPFLTATIATLKNDFSKRVGLTHFLKGNLASDGTVEILERQGSHMMSSFARANCLVVLGEAVNDLAKGDKVEVHLLAV